MFSTFLKTFRQISDPKILKALGWATLLTLIAVVLAVVLGVTLMDSILDFFSGTLQSWFGKGEDWFRGFAQFLGGSLILIISYFFFAGIHGAFVGIFIDDILDAVHEKHYSEKTWQKPPSLIQSCTFSVRILFQTLAFNLLASPILILGWFSLQLDYLYKSFLMDICWVKNMVNWLNFGFLEA